MEKKIKAIVEMKNDKITIKGDVEKIDCSFLEIAIIDGIKKVVEHYAKKFLNLKDPFLEVEEVDNIVGLYVSDTDDENKYYYVKIAEFSKNTIVYKIDFRKEDFKLMP